MSRDQIAVAQEKKRVDVARIDLDRLLQIPHGLLNQAARVRYPAAQPESSSAARLERKHFLCTLLGLFQLRARDVMGYTFLVFVVLVPVVLVLVTVLGMTLRYPL